MQTCGFVYILSNSAMPGIVKIGVTSKHPQERARELQTTGVPMPFRIEFAIYSETALDLERRVHSDLADHRISDGREFFRISVDDAISEVLSNTHTGSGEYQCVSWEHAIDRGDLNRYAHVSGACVADVTQIIDMFTDEQWVEAYAKLERKREARKLSQSFFEVPRIA